MKKVFLLLSGALVSSASFGQWLGSGPIYNNPLTANVGIGTSTPVTALTVQTASTNNGIRIIQTGTTASALGLFNSSTGARNWALFSTGSGNSQGAGNFSIYDYSGGGDRFFIQGATGNVGIGTTSPLAKLHVNNGLIRITGSNPLGGPMIVFGNGSSSPDNGAWGIEYVPSGNPGLNFWKPWPTANNGNYYMFLADNGNVGIGTNAPAYRLDVCGTIRAKEVRVETGWCDYVFEPSYKLRSLGDVELYINKNKHLPEVPSAKEIEENGLKLAEMQAIHMLKIEELTLYLIQLKKENEELKKRIECLENK